MQGGVTRPKGTGRGAMAGGGSARRSAGPGDRGLARGSAARLLRGLWSRYRAAFSEGML